MKWIKTITITIITICYILLISGYHHLDYVFLQASRFNHAIILRPDCMSDQMILIIFGLAGLSCVALWISLELNDIYQTRAEKQSND